MQIDLVLSDRTISIPGWIANMEFCHIENDSGNARLCGPSPDSERTTCKMYEGEAICPTCGLPTCPRCAQLDALEDAVNGYGEAE